jgi:hypothetical protein
LLEVFLLAGALGAGSDFVLTGLVFAVAFADLLFDLLGYQVNGGIEIAFDVLSEKVGARDSEAD